MIRFFIFRPIFAMVIAIVMLLVGAVSFFTLPVAQYPDITPPTVQVSTSFPGATPEDIANTVGQPIEKEVNGVDGMLYMESDSTADGNYRLTVTFELGTDPDMATVLVQNRVSQAMSRLPAEVTRQGVVTKKNSTAIVAIVTTSSPDKRFDDVFLSNFVSIQLKDDILRIPGVGDMTIFPQKDYAMRVWLDPQKLAARQVTALDVVSAIKAQNVQVAAGRIGAEPAPPGTVFDIGVTTTGRLSEPEEFSRIIVASRNGAVIRVQDVARVELGGQDYSFLSRRKHVPNVLSIIYQQPGSNAVEVTEAIHKLIDDRKATFPEGLAVDVDFDVANFINAAIDEVYVTLLEAFALVALVVLIFLGSWRTAIVPLIAIPVSLVATFAVMAMFGFSLNLVTLLGLVLAIGIVVDDAIVVVENVEHRLEHGATDVKEATAEAMKEVTGPVIATTLVLMSVFVPASLLPGITGELFRQFALTIAVSTGFSAVNALTLSPAMCGILLKPRGADHKKNKFSLWFDRVFGKITDGFGVMVAGTLRRVAISLVAVLALVVAALWSLGASPSGFVPAEDQGLLFLEVKMPAGATLPRTGEVLEHLSDQAEKIDGIRIVPWVAGYGMMGGRASDIGFAVVVLDDWAERAKSGRSFSVIQGELKKLAFQEQRAIGFTYGMPPIPGLGNGDGFEMRVRDVQGVGFNTLGEVTSSVTVAANAQSRLAGVATTYNAVSPQLRLDIDRDQAFREGVQLEDVFGTLSATLGNTYVNDFNRFARSFRVQVSADPEFRGDQEMLAGFNVRNAKGEMVPLGAFTRVEDTTYPNRVQRFNMYTTAPVFGKQAPGVSTGDAIGLMDQLAAVELPAGMDALWTGASFQEKRAGSPGPVLAFALLMVFLVLAAQYESWLLPVAVILTIPLALLGAAIGIASRGMPLDVFVQAGLLLLVGMAAKNAILIVEFAKLKHDEGMSIVEAALESARLRFRPIMMTSIAAILGVVPLASASGAGEICRREVGTTTIWGLLFAVILGVIATPVLFLVVMKLGKKETKPPSAVP